VKPIYVDLETLLQIVPLGKSTIEEEQRLGNFPRPRKLSGRRVGWLMADIEEWANSRPVSDLPPPANTGAPKPRSPGRQRDAEPEPQGERLAS
jgi:prophage regulatory protein